jgi:hypothetical protein
MIAAKQAANPQCLHHRHSCDLLYPRAHQPRFQRCFQRDHLPTVARSYVYLLHIHPLCTDPAHSQSTGASAICLDSGQMGFIDQRHGLHGQPLHVDMDRLAGGAEPHKRDVQLVVSHFCGSSDNLVCVLHYNGEKNLFRSGGACAKAVNRPWVSRYIISRDTN